MNSFRITNKFCSFPIIGLLFMESFLNSFELQNPDKYKFPTAALTVDDDCFFIGDGLNISDPINCRRYYSCEDNDGDDAFEASCSPIVCPGGQHFDLETKVCVDGGCSNENCLCLSTSISCADKGSGIYSIPCSCRVYYSCNGDGGPPTQETCSEGQYFVDGQGCRPGCCSKVQTPLCPPTTTTSTTSTTSTTTTTSTSTSTPASTTTSTSTPASTTTSTTTTTSTSTSTPASTTTGIVSPCQSSFTCPSNGNFRNCNYCDKTYWRCEQGQATLTTCGGNTLFNPNEAYPFCLQPSNCPYP